MLKVWGRRSSFNVQKVMWLVGELGIQHLHTPAGGDYGHCDTPEFAAMNPNRKVPVVELDGLFLWESHTILRFLAAKFSTGIFWPETPQQRSLSERWMDWSLGTLEPEIMRGLFWSLVRTPPHRRDADMIREQLNRSIQHYRLLDAILAEQPFLNGDRFGLGDIPAGATLYRYFSMDIDRPFLPNLTAWYLRLQERAAYQDHVMVSYDELIGRPEN